jgi:hypothetical protein
MTRTFLPRALGGAGIVAALVAALTLFAGSGLAQGSAAQANYAPVNTAAPAISGTTVVGQTLTASTGTWNSDTTPTFAYQWENCDAAGNNCAAITGSTSSTYTAQTADLAKTVRVVVTATNPSGASAATSAQTAAITAVATTPPIVKTPAGATAILASSVVLPDQLLIDSVKFSPARLTSRGPVVARFHVSDSQGAVVQGALIKVTALPYAWARSGGEVTTDSTGWATLTINPTINMPLRHNALVMFVRARVQGQPLLGGASNRRLVQITIH